MENQNNQSSSSSDYTKFDKKTIDTIKASAIWSAVSSAIMSISSMLISYYIARSVYNSFVGGYLGNYLSQYATPKLFDIGMLVNGVVWGAIGGAIAGFIIAKFYPVFVDWQKKITGNRLNTFFKVLFWPYVVGFAVSLVLGGALMSMSGVFVWVIIGAVIDLAAIYLYAKMMDKTVGKYYR
ncbi:MAG: hypothetical protein NTW46_03080 [Candidatus Nealsonbacteria bacterium]|nr:hypothetical protein [Candidatus Nealsonbacteria bacterium]